MTVDRDFDGLPRLSPEVGGGPIARPLPWGTTIPTVERNVSFPAGLAIEQTAAITPDGRVWFPAVDVDTYALVHIVSWDPANDRMKAHVLRDHGYAGAAVYAPNTGLLYVTSSSSSLDDIEAVLAVDPADGALVDVIELDRALCFPYGMGWSSRSGKLYANGGSGHTAAIDIAHGNVVTYIANAGGGNPSTWPVELPDGLLWVSCPGTPSFVIDPADDAMTPIADANALGIVAYVPEFDVLVTSTSAGGSYRATSRAAGTPYAEVIAPAGKPQAARAITRNPRNGLVYTDCSDNGMDVIAPEALRLVRHFTPVELGFEQYLYSLIWHPGIERMIGWGDAFGETPSATLAVLT